MDQITSILNEFEHSHLDLPTRLKTAITQLVQLTPSVPHPAEGQTLKRWQILAQVASCNLNLVKWFESHLDALSILHELGIETESLGLWAIWAAEGSPKPLSYQDGYVSGLKTWCSGIGVVQQAVLTYKNQQQQSQLISIELDQAGIHTDISNWHALGMQHTQTGMIDFNQVKATLIGEPDQYLTRAGFWHGAAGVAACWYGSASRLAEKLISACETRQHDYHLMYLGEVITALETAKQHFYRVAELIDQQPELSHELPIRILRAHVEHAATVVLDQVGKALGARPYCEDAVFAQHAADLPVFMRQSHAAFDLKQIAVLGLSEQYSCQL